MTASGKNMQAQVQPLVPYVRWTETQIKILAEKDRREAMTAVISKFRDPIFYHVVCIVKDRDEAYDLVQEVFIRACREHRFFNLDFKIKAWLYRVATNLSYNNVRNRNRRASILERAKLPNRREADQFSHVFAGEQNRQLMAAISRLSPQHQQILMLRYFDDLSYSDISDVLDIALGTVMSRLSRAKSRLRTLLEEEAD
jgi:RNA polymerase sigma-70 factor, ECF subfamily